MKNIYKTVKKSGTGEYTEKRSRFIAHVKPVSSEEEALSFLNEIKQKYWDARHNVYAYVIRENNIQRYSDDGEPSGTAGVPVLEMIKKEELWDIVVVVTRYFGGILLGTGGLVHAYSKAAKEGILNAEIKEVVLCRHIEINCDYNLSGKAEYEINLFGDVIKGDTVYGERVIFNVYVPTEKADSFVKNIIDKTNANAEINVLEEGYFDK